MTMFPRLAASGLVALALACSPAYAQRTPVFQSGTLSTAGVGSLAKFFSNGMIGSVGLTGDVNGAGVKPFTIADSLGLGLCSASAALSGAYNAFCLGHDANGNAILTVDGYGGASAGTPALRVNGVTYPMLGAVTGMASVADNTALSLLASTYATAVIRLDYSAGTGAPATVYRSSNSACSLNAGAGDGGSQVPTSDAKCWLAALSATGVDVRIWGPKPNAGSGVDAGPGFRAAAAWGTSVGGTIYVPLGDYYLNTLDSTGLGAIVVGTGAVGTSSKPSHFTGASGAGFPDTCGHDTPRLILGPSLNRPLLYLRMNAGAPHITDLCLNGNKTQQVGWAGGPGGKLFVIQIEDSVPATIDTSIHITRSVVSHGFNGGLYLGAARGAMFSRDTWYLYNGQGVGDYGAYLAGYESYFSNGLFGVNTGSGVLVGAGSQHQFEGGATFYNTDAGMVVAGGQVQHMTVIGTHFQANGCNGIRVGSAGPLPGQNSAGHQFTNPTFEANSQSGAGLCSDVLITDRINEHFVSPLFIGRAHALQELPKYNIELIGNAAAYVDSPGWGTLGATGASTLGFTNNYGRVFGNLPLEIPWTPTLVGSTGGGTPTYTYNKGTWGRQNQIVTATFAITTSALNAPTGNMQIAGLPVVSSATANNFGACHLGSFDGWTAAAGRTHLGATIGVSVQVADLQESGTAVARQATPVSEYAAATSLIGTCIYPAAAGVPN